MTNSLASLKLWRFQGFGTVSEFPTAPQITSDCQMFRRRALQDFDERLLFFWSDCFKIAKDTPGFG